MYLLTQIVSFRLVRLSAQSLEKSNAFNQNLKTLSTAWAGIIAVLVLLNSAIILNSGNAAEPSAAAKAAYEQGNNFATGKGGEQSLKKAIASFTKVATAGHSGAQYKLGQFYRNGQGGLKKDPVKAVEQFKKSASQGNVPAMLKCAGHYYRGTGTAKNYNLSLKYYTQAATKGESYAVYMVGVHHARSRGVKKDLKQAINFYKDVSNLGSTRRMNAMGSAYYRGLNVKKNYKELLGWYQKSAAAGYKRAKERLKKLGLNPQTTCPQACPDAQAHWKLKPPKWPVTSTASPIK